MGVRVLYDREADRAALYCSTSDVAFGPIFYDGDCAHDAQERAEAFLDWLTTTPHWATLDKEPLIGRGRHDARELTDAGLQAAYSQWLADEAAYWQAKEAPEQEPCISCGTLIDVDYDHESPICPRCALKVHGA